MRQKDADVLFQYLKQILFDRSAPLLSEEEVAPEFEKLVKGMNLLHGWIDESYKFAGDIAEGNLNGEEPSKDNPLCDSLKMLRSNIAHLVWQTKQVAGGDYSQRVAMMGDFSTAYNTMILQLKQREAALTEHNALLSRITDNIGEYLAVLDEETREFLYENKALTDMAREEGGVVEDLRYNIKNYDMENNGRSWEINISPREDHEYPLYYRVDSFYIDWQGRKATVHLLRDVTEQKEWESSIEYAANTDILTGLYNRRYCMEVLDGYIANKKNFYVCFADLDQLKFVNDNYGHGFGDEYIQTVADVLKGYFRKEDIICRMGGDEFLIIMENCTEKYARISMEQIRKRLLQLTEDNDIKYSMSISYGIVGCDENNMLAAEEILNESDKEMYIFKQAHRNRIKKENK